MSERVAGPSGATFIDEGGEGSPFVLGWSGGLSGHLTLKETDGDAMSCGNGTTSLGGGGANAITNTLEGAGFQFASPVPANVTITGIIARIVRRYSGPTPLRDFSVFLTADDFEVGDNKAKPDDWPLVLSEAVYGAHDDMWGFAWTPEIVNSGGFEVFMRARNPGAGFSVAHVDSIRVEVWGVVARRRLGPYTLERIANSRRGAQGTSEGV